MSDMPELRFIKWLEKNNLPIRIAVLMLVIFIIAYFIYTYQEPSYELVMKDKGSNVMFCNRTDDGAICSVYYCAESEGIISEQMCYDLQTIREMKPVQ